MKEKKSFSGWRDHLFQIYHILDSSDSFYNTSPAKENWRKYKNNTLHPAY